MGDLGNHQLPEVRWPRTSQPWPVVHQDIEFPTLRSQHKAKIRKVRLQVSAIIIAQNTSLHLLYKKANKEKHCITCVQQMNKNNVISAYSINIISRTRTHTHN